MLDLWLTSLDRSPCEYRRFKVVDVSQERQPSPELEQYLANLVLDEHIDRDFLLFAAQKLGWSGAREAILSLEIPTSASTKRGEFGECLIAALLEQKHGYSIPVRKLRFKTAANMSLHSTDVLAIKLGVEGTIAEVCFVESKLRTGQAPSVAVEACKQLTDDHTSKLPGILLFIAKRLDDIHSPLLEPFLEYMGSRDDSRDKDSFVIALCWEDTMWKETPLVNLEEDTTELPRLTVHAIRVPELRELTDRIFTMVGLIPIVDDD